MTPVGEALAAKYGWIALGIVFGFGAKYGLLIKRGKKVTARMVLADTLLIGMVALIAFNIISKLGATGEVAALVTAFLTVGADRGIRIMTDRFWAQVEAAAYREQAREIVEARGELRNVVQTVDSAKEIVNRERGS